MPSKFYLIFLLLMVTVFVVSGTSGISKDASTDRSFKTNQVYDMVPRSFSFKKKYKYLVPILLGIVVVKLLVLPLILKVISFMTGLSIVMSSASLLISALFNTFRIGTSAYDKHDDSGLPQIDRNLWTYIQDYANSTIYPYKSMLPMHK